MKLNYLFLIAFIVLGCKKPTKTSTTNGHLEPPKYATGFGITEYPEYYKLTIYSPWKDSKRDLNYALIKNNATLSTDEKFDALINIPIKRFVATSTTHLPALELLHSEHTLIGFPNTDLISSEKIRRRIETGLVFDIGQNETLNTERLINLQPDLIMAFSLNGANKTLQTIQQSGVNVVYNGDWLEKSPLAKAEWIKVFGLLLNKQQQADSIFNTIEKNYLIAKELAKQTTAKPTILSGAMHNDVWYLPSGNSTEAQLLKDANTTYIWEGATGEGSLALSFEAVFLKGKTADIWINPAQYKSYTELKATNGHYENFDAFKTKAIYTFANTTAKTGGVLYYEMGIARPDIVLKDIIKICHPTLLESYTPFFFKPLKE